METPNFSAGSTPAKPSVANVEGLLVGEFGKIFILSGRKQKLKGQKLQSRNNQKRLKLEVSQEKTRVVNVKRRYSEWSIEYADNRISLHSAQKGQCANKLIHISASLIFKSSMCQEKKLEYYSFGRLIRLE